MSGMSSIKITCFLHDHFQDNHAVYTPELCWKSACRHPRVFESGNLFRESAEVTRTLPSACAYHFVSGWLLIIGNLSSVGFTGNLGQLFPKTPVISVGVDSAQHGWVLYMCSLLTVSNKQFYDRGVGLDKHWLESLSSAVSQSQSPALNLFRPYLGRSEAGGEDSMHFLYRFLRF